MKNRIFGLFLGVLFIGLSLFMLISNASYYFMGKTVDLNEVLKNGEELPIDKFVSYTCEYPLGNYAEEQTYIGGFIPSPFKSQLYAMIDEYDGKGLIFSAKVNRNKKIKEFNSAVNEQTKKVTVVGYFSTVARLDASTYLEQNFGNIGGDVVLSYYGVDSTRTRFSDIALFTFTFALGVFCLVTFFRKRN